MTDQENEEDYEKHLYISTIMSGEISAAETKTLQLVTVSQPQPQLQQALVSTEGQEEEEVQENKPEYDLSK